MADALQLRDEREESYTGEELPAQMGSPMPTIMPGIHLFQLPANLDQCWEAKDYEKKDKDGNVVTGADGKPLVEQHLLLKFDADNPLVVVGGDHDGQPATATITTLPRRRGKKNDPDAPIVADMAYLLRESLADRTPIAKRADWIPAINRHAGAIIRLETGLSARCDPERVRYIDDGTGQGIEDPDGTKGCDAAAGKPGSRIYTNGFKTKVWSEEQQKEVPAWTDVVTCKGCGARLRGFFRVERFLRPLASTQQVATGQPG